MPKKNTILIIEDDIVLTKMLKIQIEENRPGYEVLVANDGHKGLLLINNKSPDLLLLDVNLPEIGGIEIYKRVCAKTGKPDFPVVVLSARGELKYFFESMDVEAFVPKPIEIKKLLEEIDRIMVKYYKITVEKKEDKKGITHQSDDIFDKPPPKPHDPEGMAKK